MAESMRRACWENYLFSKEQQIWIVKHSLSPLHQAVWNHQQTSLLIRTRKLSTASRGQRMKNNEKFPKTGANLPPLLGWTFPICFEMFVKDLSCTKRQWICDLYIFVKMNCEKSIIWEWWRGIRTVSHSPTSFTACWLLFVLLFDHPVRQYYPTCV